MERTRHRVVVAGKLDVDGVSVGGDGLVGWTLGDVKVDELVQIATCAQSLTLDSESKTIGARCVRFWQGT